MSETLQWTGNAPEKEVALPSLPGKETVFREMLGQEDLELLRIFDQSQSQAVEVLPKLTERQEAIANAAEVSAQPRGREKQEAISQIRQAVDEFYGNFSVSVNRPNQEMRFDISQRSELYQATFGRLIAQVARPILGFTIKNENGIIYYKFETANKAPSSKPKRSWFSRNK